MARYNTNEPTINCTCGITFATREFVRIPSVVDPDMWDRHCPACDEFWGAAPMAPGPNPEAFTGPRLSPYRVH